MVVLRCGVYLSDNSYGLMMRCWMTAPEDRPTFKELHVTVSNYIEHLAGYLQLGFNHFNGGNVGDREEGERWEQTGWEEEEVEGDDVSVSIKLIPSSVNSRVHRLFSKTNIDK